MQCKLQLYFGDFFHFPKQIVNLIFFIKTSPGSDTKIQEKNNTLSSEHS